MNNSKIEITENASHIKVATPYHPKFAKCAGRLNAVWDPSAKVWIFDQRDRARVTAILLDLFGTDGAPSEVLTLRTTPAVCSSDGTSFYLAGRLVARAFGRDSGAKLGSGVILVSGGFRSGGSVRNYRRIPKSDTVFELRDVPRAMAERIYAEYHGVDLLNNYGEIVKAATREISSPADALRIEIERLEGDVVDAESRLADLRRELESARTRLAFSATAS